MAYQQKSTPKEANFRYGRWLSTPPPGEEVVISGISGRFPESHNINEFRDHLFNKEEMVTDDGRRWILDHPEIPKRTAKIYDLYKGDAGYFGLHYRQAEYMEPMIKILAQTAVEAVMDAGINPAELEGSKTGVFVSISWSDLEVINLGRIIDPQLFGITGYLKSMAANRISYYLKLKGPSFIVDTACSSYMFALDEALKAIRSGQCDNAIVGTAQILVHPGNTLQFFRLGVLSPEGTCKVFDQDAKGYVRGETIGSMFLQKAKNSRRIYAHVISSKTNNDGFKEHGITFPSSIFQKDVMTEIYEESRIHPSTLSYLEAHGTGTPVGDPQEVEAIDEALAKRRKEPLLIGSVKSSIGHTEPASGICSIVKVLIALETGLIAPNINLNKIKEGMKGLEEGRMKVVTELTELEGEEAIVGVNNFGFGGSNAHTILRRFKKKKICDGLPEDDISRLVCVSGRTKEAVLAILDHLNRKPLDGDFVALLHQIFKYDVKGHLYRGYTIVSKNGLIKTSYNFFNQTKRPFYVVFGNFEKNFNILGKVLLEFPIFRNTMLRINGCLSARQINIIDIILRKNKSKHNLLGQVAVQLGIVEILKNLELNPTAVYGDSAGKLVTAYCYENITFENLLLTTIKIKEQNTENMLAKLNETTATVKKSLNKDSLEELINTSKNSIVLNISDQRLNTRNEILIVENNVVHFLDSLGRLYEEGHNPQVHKLYPDVQYPVSRGTPLISPLIKWNHDKSWRSYKFEGFTFSNNEQKQLRITFMDEEQKFISGHVIDGRNLLPATEYLHLVWETYAQSRRKLLLDAPVVFENCRFIKAVTMPKTGFVTLMVCIQPGDGRFEILEKDSVVVSGRIHFPEEISKHQIQLPPQPLEDDPKEILEKDEIYRELYLRGYNYSDLFKGIVKCNVDASSGLLKWENNWSTFMDKMLQMQILQIDTRLLYVPTCIKKLTIDPSAHLAVTENKEEDVLPVYLYKECNIIKSGGIEICGLQARSIARRKPMTEPVLEKHQFVPNNTELDLQTSIRINVQIILENSLEIGFKAVEVLDSANDDTEYLLPLVCKVLEDVPAVNPDLTISTKKVLENIPGVKVEDFVLTPESKLLLITGSNLLQRPSIKPILDALRSNGFILSKEDLNSSSKIAEKIEILTEFKMQNKKIILFRKSEKSLNAKFLRVSSQHFDWMPELQQALKQNSNVVVYSQNEEYDGIMGLVNCIRREPGGDKVKCFFIMDKAPEFDEQNLLYKDQIKKNMAMNVYKDSKWGTYRHLLLEELEEVESEHCFGNNLVRGDLSSLKWFEGWLSSKSQHEDNINLIDNYYSSVNFKDIMIASGRINADVITLNRIEQECVLGFEYAGIDKNGQRIMGMTDRLALATMLINDPQFSWRVPDSWSLEDAATVPTVYLTVFYAFFHGIDLKPGSSILIHSATGGIGLSALNICFYYKCEVFVTVGTQEKRDYIKKHYPQITDDHIGNSRDTSFEEMIKKGTKGRGVDIVLNSLSDDKLKASIRCLAKGGHLLEIGKFDLANDTDLNLLMLEKEINYHGVMLDKVVYGVGLRTTTIDKLVNMIQRGLDEGFVKPLPRTVFEHDEIEAAYRYMTTGKHIGKVLIKIKEEPKQNAVKPCRTMLKAIPRYHCDSMKTYVILGGLGGVGMELADWLILRNARKLLLVSSSGIKTGYQTQRINIWKSHDVKVQITKTDVTTKEGCVALIKEAKKMGPVDAIFNLAVVLKDALFEDQTEESFRISSAPKAQATLYLDQVTRELCPELRHFVIFSSVSCGRGNAGQTNYGMANSIMERICEKRKRDGFPALAIQWGAIGEVGLVAKMQKENKELVIGGTLQQKISSCMEVLDKFMKQNNPVVSSMVVAEKLGRLSGNLGLVDTVAALMGIKDLKTVSQYATLPELGLDSMMGTEMLQILEKDFDIFLTAKDLRTLTFAKLKELEEERNNTLDDQINSKTQKDADFLVQIIPDSRTSEEPVVELFSNTTDENATPAFILTGIEGVFKTVESLSKNIKSHVFGLQYSYLHPKESVAETAEVLLPHLEEKLTNKTFHIVAYSYGVLVAVELAHLLESKGYKGKLVFLDGSPKYIKTMAKEQIHGKTDAERQTDLLLNLIRLILPVDVVENLQDKLLECASFEERIDFALSIPGEVENRQKLEKQAALTLYSRFKAAFDYEFLHEKIKSDVYLFRAKKPIVSDMDNEYKLLEICEGPVMVSEVDGTHFTILEQNELFENINKWLNYY